MKPIVDRTKEMLNAADTAIVNVRKSVIQAVREFQAGETPACVKRAEVDEASIVAAKRHHPRRRGLARALRPERKPPSKT